MSRTLVSTLLLFVVNWCIGGTMIFAGHQPPPTGTRIVGRTPRSTDPVIVVGGGLAGLSAALEALENGASVVIVDKEADFGGNSAKASSGITGCNTDVQRAMGIKDSTDLCYSDTMAAGDRDNDPALVDVLVHESANAVNFLIENGVNLGDVNLCGGHSVPRLHWIPSPKEGKPLPVGVAIIRALKAKLLELQEAYPQKVDVRLNTTVVGLVTWNDYVTGVRYRNAEGKIEEITGKAVILSTGGFASDRSRNASAEAQTASSLPAENEPSLLAEFAREERIHRLPTTNGRHATGDGVKMARAMGAAVVGMEHIQVHPTAFVDPAQPDAHVKFLAAEALRGKGAILLNERGQRFGDELGRRDVLSQQIFKNCAANAHGCHTAYMVMNDASADQFGRPAFNFYSKVKRFFTEVENVDKLAEHIGCDASALRDTLAEYNALAEEYATKSRVDPTTRSVKDRFGKTVFPVAFAPDEKLYVAVVTPAVHYTIGGLKIDRQAFVFSEFMNQPFKGLLAAGEVTGGVHGRNRLAGNSLLECVVFGRLAGRSSAALSYGGHEEL